jgi:hypothetical protein
MDSFAFAILVLLAGLGLIAGLVLAAILLLDYLRIRRDARRD